MRIRGASERDRDDVERFLEPRHSARVARRGELLRPREHAALMAEAADGSLAGVLTYIVGDEECEILTLHAESRRGGVGTALVDAVAKLAAEAGCRRLRVTTTNDNVDALWFYQRRGFRLDALHAGAVDESRARLKPEIPRIGEHGIPLRDEIELVRPLDG